MAFAKTSKNHKLASLKMVRKSPKSRDESDKNDFWNIVGFVGFLATTCLVMGVIVSGKHHGAHAIARRSIQNMNYYGKFFCLNGVQINAISIQLSLAGHIRYLITDMKRVFSDYGVHIYSLFIQFSV